MDSRFGRDRMRSSYIVIVGDKVKGQFYSLNRAKKWADQIEEKYRENCDVAKIMRR